ncbi:MAG: L-aspartate oxidase [Acidobacteria bacterium]|nr:L-aspartate oxidase [Acidobacteriota bacterium]
MTTRADQVDFVIVGSGIAGLRAAIELGQHGTVLVLAKSALNESATEYAQGGIAAALSDDDEVSLHEQDTLMAGDGLCNPEAVHVLVEEGPQYIQELIAWGTQFDRAGTKLAFTREGAHSRSRILHAHGDSTGREIGRALFAKAQTLRAVQFKSHAFTTRLLVESGKCVGLEYLEENSGKRQTIQASAVLLATGGLGQIYPETTNPSVATGDGMAIAYEAGAALSDLEFVQFHPTALAVKGAPHFLLSEALRGEGGVLRNVDTNRFMKHHHEAAELAPRDVVARAIVAEMHRTKTDYVYLDMTNFGDDFLQKRFPRIYSTCQSYGLDIAADLIPVRPAAHYSMGGVQTGLHGHTTLAGLFAAGETAATGVHGANRLASNSLLEGLVFGARAGQSMLKASPNAAKSSRCNSKHEAATKTGDSHSHAGKSPISTPGHTAVSSGAAAAAAPATALDQIRKLMWRGVGIIREGKELKHTIEQLAALHVPRSDEPSRAACELYNLWNLAQLIARSALAREESRGSHYRSDFPYRDNDKFNKHSFIQSGKAVSFT